MRHITQAGIDLIKKFEGFSPTVYICPAGYPTIGYGHVVKPQERQQFASGITNEQAETLLRQDVQTAERAVLRLITVPLTDGRAVRCVGLFHFQPRCRCSATLHYAAEGQSWLSCRRACGVQEMGLGWGTEVGGAGEEEETRSINLRRLIVYEWHVHCR